MNSKKSTPASARPFKPVIAQVKTVPSPKTVKRPVAPPVYKPQAKPVAAQLKKAGPPQVKTHPVAPIAYRPQPTPAVLQRHLSPTKPPDRKPVAPPVYRPQPSPKVLQTKKVGPQPLRSTGGNPNVKSTTSNTIQRSLDPLTMFGVGALVVGAIGVVVYGAGKCAAGDRQPEAPAPEEKKEVAITREAVVRRAEALRLRAKDRDIRSDIEIFVGKIDKFSSYEYANNRLTDIEKRIAGRERSAMGSGSAYATSVEAPKVRRVKVKKQEEKKELKVVRQDIKPKFNRATACVLFALARLKGGAFGVNSAERLHDLFWEREEYEDYRQYSDISVIRALFDDPGTNMREVEDIEPDTVTMGDLPDMLPAGRYAVITRSSVSVSDDDEEHMLLLENGAWFEFRGYFQEARRDDNALVRGVWR